MTTMKRVKTLLTVALATSMFFTACKKDKVAEEPQPDLMKYFVGMEVGDAYYTVPAKDITTGNLTVVGKGIENIGYHSVVKDGFLYSIAGEESLLEKYKITETGIEKVDVIATAPVMSGSFPRYIDLTETNDIILMNKPNATGSAPYAIIDLATFKVEKHGSIQLPAKGNYKPTWCRSIVSGNKVYVATEYTLPGVFGDIPKELTTVVYDYPAFTNSKVITSTASAGSVAGYRTNGSFKDEKGDIYQYNFRSNQWSSKPADVATTPTVFVKITNGDYDNSYSFDVSSKFPAPISIWNAWYAGNGIVYANVISESDLDAWAKVTDNVGQLYKIDIYKKEVLKLNIPKAPFVNIFSLNSVVDGNFYIPVSIKGGAANIYQIKVGGGANDFKVGAKLDGANVFAPSITVLK